METNCDIARLIHNGGIYTDVEGKTPAEIFEKVSKMIDLPDGTTSELIYNSLCAREKVLSTAVGNGIALPHARTPIVKNDTDQKICVVYLKEPIDMNAPDERDVFVMFILLTSNSQFHLKVLSSLAGLFRDVKFRKALENHADEATLLPMIRELA